MGLYMFYMYLTVMIFMSTLASHLIIMLRQLCLTVQLAKLHAKRCYFKKSPEEEATVSKEAITTLPIMTSAAS